MKLDQMRVVVAGAGTGGCAVALLLARAGAEVTLFERVAEPRAVGAGIGLAENGWAVLQALGQEARLEGAARPVAGARIVDAAGRTIFDPGPEAPKLRMIRRSDLQNAQLDAVAAEPGIDALPRAAPVLSAIASWDELRRAPEVAAALRAYEARRLPAVTRVANVAHRLGALAEWTSAPARALRDRLLMPLAGRLGDRSQQAELVLQEPLVELRKIASS